MKGEATKEGWKDGEEMTVEEKGGTEIKEEDEGVKGGRGEGGGRG